MSLPSNKQGQALVAGGGPAATPGVESAVGASQVVHELANLLDGCLRNVGLAISRLQESSVEEDHEQVNGALGRLRVADQAMQQMAVLIRQWMRRSPSPGWSVMSEAQTLGQAVRGAVDLFSAAAAQQGIEVCVDLPEHAVSVPAGPAFTVLVNALRNSIQAIGSGGRIDVAVRVEGVGVEIEVCDDGPGLDESVLDEAGLLRFGRTTKPDGSGIGLSLCRDLVKGMGGNLQVSSRKPRGVILAARYPVGPKKMV